MRAVRTSWSVTPRRSAALLMTALLATTLLAACGSQLAAPSLTTRPVPSASPSQQRSGSQAAATTPSPTPVVTPAPTPSPAPTASPLPTPAGSATADGWRPLPDQEAVTGVQFTDIVWTGERFVAVGAGLDDAGAFLDSSDGFTWHRQPDLDRGWRPSALAAGEGGVVAVGTIDDAAATWRSTDGLFWTATTDALSGSATSDASVADVIATASGWLAVGGETDVPCATDCSPIRALSWTSTDGATWTRSPDQQSLAKAEFTSVTRVGDGFVAGGRQGTRAAVWKSTDGAHWTRMTDDVFGKASAETFVTGMAANDQTIVAVGIDAGSDPVRARAWYSASEGDWAEAKVELAAHGQLFSATPVTDGFLAVGPSDGDSCRGGIWSSHDGSSWRCIARDRAMEGFGPSAVGVSPTVEVAVGLTSKGFDEESPDGLPGAAWWRPVQ